MATVTQIAKAAGVSRVCASQVLNNTPNTRVSQPVRERILRLARQMNYVPRQTTSQRHPRSRAIAYVLAARTASQVEQSLLVSSTYHFRELNHLQQVAIEHERAVLFLTIRDDRESLAQVVRLLELERPLGVVLDGAATSPQVRALRRLGLPMVVAGVTPYAFSQTHVDVATVSPDPADGATMLLNWLCEKGCQRIALATGPTWMLINRMMIEAYQQHIRQLGLAEDAGLIQVSDLEHGVAVFERYLQLGVAYDGILFANWNMAVAAMPLIQQHMPTLPVAALGSRDVTDQQADRLAVAGVCSSHYAKSIYDVLDAQIQNPRRRKPNLIVPYELHVPAVPPEEAQQSHGFA